MKIWKAAEPVLPIAETMLIRRCGLGTSIVFLDPAGDLVRAPEATLEPETLTSSVSHFWPIANSAEILAVSDGVLRLVSADAP